MPALAAARTRAEKLRSLVVKNPEQMTATLAEGWRDREAGIAVELSRPSVETRTPTAAPNLVLSLGQRVRHMRFGDGVVTRIDGAGGEAMISILFDAGEERTFQADLLYDKLELIDA